MENNENRTFDSRSIELGRISAMHTITGLLASSSSIDALEEHMSLLWDNPVYAANFRKALEGFIKSTPIEGAKRDATTLNKKD